MLEKSTTIVGLGLMGGSLALALRPHIRHLVVVDKDLTTLAAAEKLADEVTNDVAQGVRQADLVILATPLQTILHLLGELPRWRPEGCMVLDLGSTKVVVGQTMEKLPACFQAIGGHPMCGKETSTFAAAESDLYQNHTFVLCRNGRSHPDVERTACDIIHLLGARPLFLAADTHDRLVAATSHLPYLAAASLIRCVNGLADDRAWQVSASGLRDTTRLASSDPRMMSDILLTNREEVLAQMIGYQQELSDVIQLIQSADDTSLIRWLSQVQQAHYRYRQQKALGTDDSA